MANSVDPDEMAHNEPSHQDLHCLHRYWFWSAGLKGINKRTKYDDGDGNNLWIVEFLIILMY